MISINNFRITELSKFFPKHLKKYHYIKNSNGFNMGMCKFKDVEMFCVRMLGTIPAYFGELVVPGNYSGDYYMQEKNKICKFGVNFFWNNWRNVLIDNTIFF